MCFIPKNASTPHRPTHTRVRICTHKHTHTTHARNAHTYTLPEILSKLCAGGTSAGAVLERRHVGRFQLLLQLGEGRQLGGDVPFGGQGPDGLGFGGGGGFLGGAKARNETANLRGLGRGQVWGGCSGPCAWVCANSGSSLPGEREDRQTHGWELLHNAGNSVATLGNDNWPLGTQKAWLYK